MSASCALAVSLIPFFFPGSAPAWGLATTTSQLPRTVLALDLLKAVPVRLEHRGGYDRGLFQGWTDADHDGCDTRAEVLQRESRSPIQTSDECTVGAGDWLSTYDGRVVDDASDLEIDHVVALKEAWDSGAFSWTGSRRAAYANDLSDHRTLRAVTVSANRSKGDKDPSNWLPAPADQCRYLGDWIAIKTRWGLSADQSEWGRVRNVLRARCPRLTIVLSGATPESLPLATVDDPTTTVKPEARAGSAAAGPFANCAAARAAGAAPIHRGDPGYRSGLDGDGDGIACET